MSQRKTYIQKPRTGSHWIWEGSKCRKLEPGELLTCYPEELGGAGQKFDEVEPAAAPSRGEKKTAASAG